MAKGKRKGKHKEQDKDAAKGGAARDSAAKPSGGHTPVLKRRKLPNWPLLALAAAGALLSGYLTATSWLGSAPAYCGEGSACDLVQSSRWGTLLGLPMAAWGFLAYAALGYVALRVRDPERHWKAAWLIALTSLAVSVYLTAVSVLVIEATCAYCLGSLGVIAATVGVLVWQRPEGLPAFSWPAWGGQTAGVAAVLVLALHLHFSGVFSPAAGPEDPYLVELTEHLQRTGAVFYGAYW